MDLPASIPIIRDHRDECDHANVSYRTVVIAWEGSIYHPVETDPMPWCEECDRAVPGSHGTTTFRVPPPPHVHDYAPDHTRTLICETCQGRPTPIPRDPVKETP